MPFVNNSQRKACYAKQNADNKKGKKPSWDCAKWDRETVSNVPFNFCGALCKDFTPCIRDCKDGKCWQHCNKK